MTSEKILHEIHDGAFKIIERMPHSSDDNTIMAVAQLLQAAAILARTATELTNKAFIEGARAAWHDAGELIQQPETSDVSRHH